jgi:hypothetical protein
MVYGRQVNFRKQKTIAMVRIQVLLVSLFCVTGLFGQRLMPVGEGVTGIEVRALEVYDGMLIVGGWYTSFNGTMRRNLQGWDGSAQIMMPGAFDELVHRVWAMQVMNGDLIVAGRDDSRGHIARWNGSTWSNMGGGLPAQARAMVQWQGDLVVGCANGEVLRWNGQDWISVGAPLNASVLALEVYQGELYVGGSFTAMLGNTMPLYRLARLTSLGWVPVGNGLNGQVDCLRSDAMGLLIGGSFTQNGSGVIDLDRCARWQGDQLLPLENVRASSGVSGFFRMPDGELRIGNATVNGRTLDISSPRVLREYNGAIYLGGGSGARSCYRATGPLVRVVPGQVIELVDVNGIGAMVSPQPFSFYNWPSNRQGYEVYIGEGTHTMAGTAPWLRGKAGEVVYESAPAYAISNVEWPTLPWSGPQANTMNDAYYERYHRVWRLDRAMVQNHISNWDDPGYTPHPDIRDWPGNGSQQNGEPAQLAPFFDMDGDGLYEPYQGDYPEFKGTQAVYSIQHTGLDPFVSLDVPVLPFDLHVMQYAFESDDAAIKNTVFVKYKFINRGEQVFDSLVFGQFADFDIGCPHDDLFGCDSTRSLFFGYNGSDSDPGCEGVNGFLGQQPSQGVRILNSAMRSHSLAIRLNPPTQTSFVDILHGTVQGQPFTEAGYPSHFQFPGGVWTDTLVTPATIDRKSVGATGPFTLGPGDTLCIDLAFIYARAPSGGAFASVETLKLRSDSVQAYYNAQGLSCRQFPVMTGLNERTGVTVMQVYPNPASQQVIIAGLMPGELLVVLDLQGRTVYSARAQQERITLDVGAWAPGAYVARSGNAAVRILKE